MDSLIRPLWERSWATWWTAPATNRLMHFGVHLWPDCFPDQPTPVAGHDAVWNGSVQYRAFSNVGRVPSNSQHHKVQRRVNIPEKFWLTVFKLIYEISRDMSLTTILLMAGLDMDAGQLKRLSIVVAKLAFFPCLAEAIGVAVAAHFLLDMPWLWGLLLG